MQAAKEWQLTEHQDIDEAITKAQDFTNNNAIELKTTRESLNQEMRTIQRATAEETEQRRQRIAEQQELHEQFQRDRIEKHTQMIADGIYPFGFGNYVGQKFNEAPITYINWLVNNRNTFEEGSLIQLLSEAVSIQCKDLILPTPNQTAVIGQPKQHLLFDATVIKSTSFPRQSYDGWSTDWVYVTTLYDHNTEACLIIFSTAFSADVGERLQFKATIKAHSEYNNQAQTVICRVTILGR